MDFILNDVSDGHDNQVKGSLIIEKDGLGLLIKVDGYGDHDSEDRHGCPVILELHEGTLRLLVWDDINIEEPTIIPLDKAAEHLRFACDSGTLTVGQVRKYCKGNGVSCLFCGSIDLSYGEWDTQDFAVYRNVTCGGCGKEWQDQYKLTGVDQNE